MVLNGQIPKEVRSLFFGASLTAWKKKDGGIRSLFFGASLTALKKKDGGIRPIAVGLTLRRLACEIVCFRCTPAITQSLMPNQVGCGVKGGAKAAIHDVRSFLLSNTGERVLLKLDFKNAFNMVRRDRLLMTARSYLPEYVTFLESMYGSPSDLFFGNNRISSETGIQQGDPLGPLLFCVASCGLVKSMRSEMNVWYLDDGMIGGDAAAVLDDLERVIEQGKQIGLELHFPKCELFYTGSTTNFHQILQQFRNVAPGIIVRFKSELLVLGSPVYTQGVPDVFKAKKSEFKRLS